MLSANMTQTLNSWNVQLTLEPSCWVECDGEPVELRLCYDDYAVVCGADRVRRVVDTSSLKAFVKYHEPAWPHRRCPETGVLIPTQQEA